MKTGTPRTCFADIKGARAFQQSFTTNAATAAKKAANHFVSARNTHQLRHGGEWYSPANPHDSAGQMLTHSAEISVNTEDLIEQRLEVLSRAITELGKKMHEQFFGAFVGIMEQATEESGNVVNGAARPISETFLEMLEKSHWSVNQAGEIEPPTIMSGSNLHSRLTTALQQAPPEFHARADAIIQRKVEEARREEVERQARFSHYGDA